MKIGCGVWSLTGSYEAPFEEGILSAADLGFEGIELMVYSSKDLRGYYTSSKIKELKKLYTSQGLVLSQLAVYTSLVQDFSSFDKRKKKNSLAVFERTCEIAQNLGTTIISIVAHWPEGLNAPVPYPPSYIYTYVPGIKQFSPKLKFGLPEDFSWEKTWENYVESMSLCAELAREYGLRFALESHPHTIISSTDAYLRLFDHVKSPSLGANLDTGYPFVLREYLPVTISKLGTKIFHVHVRDGDGLLCYNLPAGQGIIDWEGVIGALRKINYQGFLSLELTRYKEGKKYAKIAKDYLEKIMANALPTKAQEGN